jgi:hypothetical protein
MGQAGGANHQREGDAKDIDDAFAPSPRERREPKISAYTIEFIEQENSRFCF